MPANFQIDYIKPLAADLENGRLGNAEEFATAITRYYMRTITKGAPIGIPPTLPAPTLQGAPGPVGPATAPNTQPKERVFKNTVKAYFLAKEISQGKANIQDLLQSYKQLLLKARKTKNDITTLITEIQQIDDQVRDLARSIREIGPGVVNFIQDRVLLIKQQANVFQNVFNLPQALGDQTVDEEDFRRAFSEELQIIEFFSNFRPSLKLSDYRQIFLYSQRVESTIKRLRNATTNESNRKFLFYSKLRKLLQDIISAISGFLQPESYIAFWKELTYIPKYRGLSIAIVNYINSNKVLKEKKRVLLVRLKNKKANLETQVNSKIQQIKEVIQKRIQENGKKSEKQRKTYIDSAKKARRIERETRLQIKTVKNQIRLLSEILKDSIALLAKVDALVQETSDITSLWKSQIEDIKSKYIGIADSPNEPFSINLILKTYKVEIPQLRLFITGLLDAYQIASTNAGKDIFRIQLKKLDVLVGSLFEIIDVDVPSLIQKIEQVKLPVQIKFQRSSTKRPKIANLGIFVKLFQKLRRLVDNITKKVKALIKKLTNQVKDKLEKTKVIVRQYINELTDKLSVGIRTKNKKRKAADEKSSKKKTIDDAKILYAKLNALAAIIGAGGRIFSNLTQKRFSVADSERDLKKLFANWLKFQVLDGNITQQQVGEEQARFFKRIENIKVYELLVKLFKQVLTDIKTGNITQSLTSFVNRQTLYIGPKAKQSFDAFVSFISNPPTKINLNTINSLSLDFLQIKGLLNQLYLAEQGVSNKLRASIETLKNQIPADTTDPILLAIKKGVGKASSVLVALLTLVKKALQAVEDFIRGTVKRIESRVKKRIDRIKQRQVEDKIKRSKSKIERDVNADARGMSLMFNLAAKLFWTGLTWTTPTGTIITVTSIGRFATIKAKPEDGAQGFASETGNSFDKQMRTIKGIYTNPSLGIAPIQFVGYA